jgi:hypothetical protein
MSIASARRRLAGLPLGRARDQGFFLVALILLLVVLMLGLAGCADREAAQCPGTAAKAAVGATGKDCAERDGEGRGTGKDADPEGSGRASGSATRSGSATGAPGRLLALAEGMAIRLGAPEAARLGLELRPLTSLSLPPESHAQAVVMDLTPLIAFREEYRDLSAEVEARATLLANLDAELKRLRILHGEAGSVSTRHLQQQEAERAAAALRLAAQRQRLEDRRAAATQSFGPVLVAAMAARAPGAPPEGMGGLLDGGEVLLLLSLPPEGEAAAIATLVPVGGADGGGPQIAGVGVGGGDDGDGADGGKGRIAGVGGGGGVAGGGAGGVAGLGGARIAARLLSAAPRTDPAVQAGTWFYRAPAAGLRVGHRLDAFLPARGEALTGARVPVAAVVWQAGRPWIYVQQREGIYLRHALDGGREMGDDWIVPDLAPGRLYVHRGGQMLLSEELRGNIPAEGDD